MYAARCVEMGQLIQVPVLDLWTLMQQEPDWSSFLSDGLHLTPKGTDVVIECCYRMFRQLNRLPANTFLLLVSLFVGRREPIRGKGHGQRHPHSLPYLVG